MNTIIAKVVQRIKQKSGSFVLTAVARAVIDRKGHKEWCANHAKLVATLEKAVEKQLYKKEIEAVA